MKKIGSLNTKLLSIAILVIAIGVASFILISKNNQPVNALQTKFATLTAASSDFCSNLGQPDAITSEINSLSNTARLQGACCSPMDFTAYKEQLDGLKAYKNISYIAPDPYDVPASLAKSLLTFDQTIVLTASQQQVYEAAGPMTHDKGWCCCKCWAWYTHSGLAKYLITKENFNAKQVATVTNLEDCCGGPPDSSGYIVT